MSSRSADDDGGTPITPGNSGRNTVATFEIKVEDGQLVEGEFSVEPNPEPPPTPPEQPAS